MNRIIADKKPYFFKYKYKQLNKELNDYIKKTDENARMRFSRSLDDLLTEDKELLSPEEIEFLAYYDKFLPVINTDCVMNKVCKHIESIDFHIKQKVRSTSDFDYKVLQSENFTVDSTLLKALVTEINTTLKTWHENAKNNSISKVQKSLNSTLSNTSVEKIKEIRQLRSRLFNICSNEEKLTNHMVYIFYVEKPSLSKSILWEMFGRQIFNNVKSKTSSFYFPVPDENGDINYLYEKFKLSNVQVEDIFPIEEEETVEDKIKEDCEMIEDISVKEE